MQAEFIRWKNRRALMLNNGSLQMTVLAGGGHIADLRITDADPPSPNLLCESPWVTADPDSVEFTRLRELYGGAPIGPFLAGYTGHTLCLDIFGPPSSEDAVRGIPLHGEASARMWELVPADHGCSMHVKLPVSQLEFSRTIRAELGQSVLFVEECLTNTGPDAREVHWVQHVSLGPPLLSAENSFLRASVDRCRTWPDGYEGRPVLPDSVDFAWPCALTLSGGTTDLRLPFQHEGKGFMAAAHVAESSTVAHFAALNPRAGFALVYCFRREEFPWIAMWEENCARRTAPWNGNSRVRSMEFGTTPMPVGREAIHAMGTLFDSPVSRSLPAGDKVYARYAICAARLPRGLREVDTIAISDEGVILTNDDRTDSVVIAADGILHFLTERQNAE